MKNWKKTGSALLMALFCCAAGFADEIAMPKAAVAPGKNGINTQEWAAWPKIETLNCANQDKAPAVPVDARFAYDAENLYFACRVPVTGREVFAGHGGGVPWQNDCINFAVQCKDGKMFRVYIDGAGRKMTKRGYNFCAGSGYTAAARVVKDFGFDVFLAIPWKTLGRTAPKTGEKVPFTLQYWQSQRPAIIRPFGLGGNGNEQWALVASDTVANPGSGVDADAAKVLTVNHEDRVVNFGRGGYNSAEVLNMLGSILDYQPTLVVVMVGTNDVVYKIKSMDVVAYRENVRKIMDTLLKAGCKVIWVTMPPCCDEIVIKREGNDFYGGVTPNVKIALLNRAATQLADARNIPVVDFWSKAARRGNFDGKESLLRNPANTNSADGVHPTAEGYELIAGAVLKCAAKNGYSTERVACVGDSITFGSAMEGAGTTEGVCYPAVLRKLLLEADAQK